MDLQTYRPLICQRLKLYQWLAERSKLETYRQILAIEGQPLDLLLNIIEQILHFIIHKMACYKKLKKQEVNIETLEMIKALIKHKLIG
jgi:hypothetical protein